MLMIAGAVSSSSSKADSDILLGSWQWLTRLNLVPKHDTQYYSSWWWWDNSNSKHWATICLLTDWLTVCLTGCFTSPACHMCPISGFKLKTFSRSLGIMIYDCPFWTFSLLPLCGHFHSLAALLLAATAGCWRTGFCISPYCISFKKIFIFNVERVYQSCTVDNKHNAVQVEWKLQAY